jgi:hypothetical protein
MKSLSKIKPTRKSKENDGSRLSIRMRPSAEWSIKKERFMLRPNLVKPVKYGILSLNL